MLTIILCLFLNTSCLFISMKNNHHGRLVPNKNETPKIRILPHFNEKDKNYTGGSHLIINPFKPRPIGPVCCLNFPPPKNNSESVADNVKQVIHEIIKIIPFFV
jgi:hypothetical protein